MDMGRGCHDLPPLLGVPRLSGLPAIALEFIAVMTIIPVINWVNVVVVIVVVVNSEARRTSAPIYSMGVLRSPGWGGGFQRVYSLLL